MSIPTSITRAGVVQGQPRGATASRRGAMASQDTSTRAARGACAECARRSWLLSRLSGPLDYCARDRERLQALLALGDTELIDAIGGRRRAELRAQYDAVAERARHGDDAPYAARDSELGDPRPLRRGDRAEAICRHDRRYPRALLDTSNAPRMLNVAGGVERMSALCSAPAVAILGSPRPSDYGRAVARGLARGLSASGVSAICAWRDGIAIAALDGALEAGGAAVAVVGDGLDVSRPVRRRALLSRLVSVGCAVSELPCDCNGRRWAQLAAERTVVALAAAVIVVEAEHTAGELAAVKLARALGRPVAAVPGRVSSPLSQGTNALLRSGGARIVLDVQDVLELLYETDPSRAKRSRADPSRAHASRAEPSWADPSWAGPSQVDASLPEPSCAPLEPRLRDVLERVAAGSDTPDRLADEGVDLNEALMALSELELMGLLSRGDGGRYLPNHPFGRCK